MKFQIFFTICEKIKKGNFIGLNGTSKNFKQSVIWMSSNNQAPEARFDWRESLVHFFKFSCA